MPSASLDGGGVCDATALLQLRGRPVHNLVGVGPNLPPSIPFTAQPLVNGWKLANEPHDYRIARTGVQRRPGWLVRDQDGMYETARPFHPKTLMPNSGKPTSRTESGLIQILKIGMRQYSKKIKHVMPQSLLRSILLEMQRSFNDQYFT